MVMIMIMVMVILIILIILILLHHYTTCIFIMIQILITVSIVSIVASIIVGIDAIARPIIILPHNSLNPRITHHLSNTDPRIRIFIQTLINKSSQLNTDEVIIIHYFYILYINFKLSLILPTPRKSTM